MPWSKWFFNISNLYWKQDKLTQLPTPPQHNKTDLHSFRSHGLIIVQFRLGILLYAVIVLRTLALPIFHLSQKETHPRVSMESQNDTSSASPLTTLGWHYKMTTCTLFGRKKDEKVLSSWLRVCLHSHCTFSYNSF